MKHIVDITYNILNRPRQVNIDGDWDWIRYPMHRPRGY
jgi:hypothetical protein